MSTKSEWVACGENVLVREEDGKLLVAIDLGAKTRPSKSGKTQILASTGGFQSVRPGMGLSLNLTQR